MVRFRSPTVDRDLGLLFAVMLVIGAGNTALQSIMPALGRSLKIDDHYIAAAFSVSAFAWMFAAPFWAKRSDRAGLKLLVLLGIGGFVVSVLLCAIFLTAGIHGWMTPLATLFAFIGARMIYGLFGAAAPPAAQAIVAGETSREDRTRALTLLASAFGLGTILGPAFAPLFVLPGVSLAGPAYAFAAMAMLVFIAIAIWLPNDRPGGWMRRGRGAVVAYPTLAGTPTGASVNAAAARNADKDDDDDQARAGKPVKPHVRVHLPMFDRRVWPWLLVGLIAGHAQAIGGQAIGFLVIDRLGLAPLAAQQSITIVLMAGAAAALLVQWGVIPMLDLRPRTLVVVGVSIAAVGAAAIASANSLYTIMLAFALASAGYGFVRPGYTAGASLAVGADLQAVVAGRVTSVNGASFILGPTIGVGLYQWNHGLPYWLAACLCVVALIYSLWQISARG